MDNILTHMNGIRNLFKGWTGSSFSKKDTVNIVLA